MSVNALSRAQHADFWQYQPNKKIIPSASHVQAEDINILTQYYTMIESLVNLREMEEKPYLAFVWAMIVNSVAVIFSTQVHSIGGIGFGFFVVLFTIIPSVFFITMLIRREEEVEEAVIKSGGGSFWENHGNDILILLYYFFGVTMSFAIWTFLLPTEAFTIQLDKINEIRGTGAFLQTEAVTGIFLNNLQVMLVAFIFSLVFGAGAIFIIVWNASVLGVYIGQLSKEIWHIPLVSLSFLPHGIPEIAGYLSASLAGGIISAAMLRKRKGIMRGILLDSLKLLLLGVALIALAAVIEVYV